VSGAPDDSPLFNRALQGVYELGSTFKVFTIAQALELDLVAPETMIDTRGPLRWGKHRIRDFHDYGKELDVTTVLTKSSNIGTARIAQMIGPERQKAFLDGLGLLAPTEIEMPEARGGTPLLPKHWSEISAMTISYGHGLAATPLHLAASFATIANGGRKITPTLLKQDGPRYGARVVSPEVAAQMNGMMRKVVTEGTASFGDVAGYAVGGKTGTADKAKPDGGYYKDRVITSFASVFPANDPRYVLVVSLDEPEIYSYGENRRSAGWTAVPVAAEYINRIAPLLGLRPDVEPGELAGITLTSN
jgi:cell division protein FtsI (penicillin-binding protein 3)